jgi:hypothetical protein
MQLSRRASWFLIAFAGWSWFIWVTLVKNISADSRSWSPSHSPTAFLAVHVTLAAISIVFGTAIGWLGLRGLRASKPVGRRSESGPPAESAGERGRSREADAVRN